MSAFTNWALRVLVCMDLSLLRCGGQQLWVRLTKRQCLVLLSNALIEGTEDMWLTVLKRCGVQALAQFEAEVRTQS